MDDKDKETMEAQEPQEDAVNESDRQDEATPLQAKEAECEKLSRKYLRAIADQENYRKRAAREQQRAAQFAVAALARALLPATDNIERALKAAEEGHDFEALARGVGMVEQQIHQALRDNSIEPIDALHKPFDPNFHEVVIQEESEEHQEGTITKVFEKGFQIGDIVLRAAKVAVAAAPQPKQTEQETEKEPDEDMA